MRFKKLFGVMLAIMVSTSMAVLAETAHYVQTGPVATPWNTAVNLFNRGAVTANCTLKVFGCNGTQRIALSFPVPANALVVQPISQAGAFVTIETAVVSCDQPAVVYSDVSIAAGPGQGAVKAISAGLAGLDYQQRRSMEGLKGGAAVNNTRIFCHNPTTGTETVTFTARDANGNLLASTPTVAIVSRGCLNANIDDPLLFGNLIGAGFSGLITLDVSGAGAAMACAAFADLGNGQFVYIPLQPFWSSD